MAHDHHHHGPTNYNRVFAVGIALNVIYIVVEAGYGFYANSLALLADAGHNLSDVLGLLLAWGAHWLSKIQPTAQRTYGWRSSSILAALANAIILVVAVGGIVWEAAGRFGNPQPPSGITVMWVSGVGVVINTITALMFFSGRKGDLNIKGAFLHMAADAGISLGVVLAGLAIYLTGQPWIDPVVSIALAAVIFVGTWGLLRDSFNLALQAVPSDIDPQAVKQYLAGLDGVEHVHDVHIWAMSTTETALTAHLVKPEVADDDPLLTAAIRGLDKRFHIHHATLQIERNMDNVACPACCDEHV